MLGDLGKLIVAKGFKNLPEVQKIAQSGHTDCMWRDSFYLTVVLYQCDQIKIAKCL